jgi:heme/copper-type cytochrome/quinol oxidase subunit 2
MNKSASQDRPHIWKILGYVAVVILAVLLAAGSAVFGFSAWTAKKQNTFERLTSLSSVWALVLAAFVAAVAMIVWVVRANRKGSSVISRGRPRWRLISVHDCQPSDVRVHTSLVVQNPSHHLMWNVTMTRF